MNSFPKDRFIPANNHWWPVGIQHYWKDKNGEISRVFPRGKVETKKQKNKKIGFLRHSHTVMKENPVWAYSFEVLFQSVDNSIRDTIDYTLKNCGPIGDNYKEALVRAWRALRGHREYKDVARKFKLEKEQAEKLFRIIVSLLIRSPANIDRLANFPMAFGMPRSESIGKVNLHHQTQNWLTGSEQKSSFQFFVFIFAPKGEFIFGDGLFDEITGRHQGTSVGRDCLVPLTPKLAVFCFGVNSIHNGINAAFLVASKSILNYVNEITQIYSKDKIYYSSIKPQLSEHFTSDQRLAITQRREGFFADLKMIPQSLNNHFNLGDF